MKHTALPLNKFVRSHIVAIAWTTVFATVLAATFVWGHSNQWQIGGLETYKLFPLFGLIAFSVFWSQYVVATLAAYVQAQPALLTRYLGITNVVVFLALLLHPGLLAYQLWKDGFGLPPQSILQHAVLPGFEWLVLLGMTSWVVFMFYMVTYKLHSFFHTKKWWLWFGYVGEVAMIAVFYHGFRLGHQLQAGWFRGVWIGYGIVLVVAIAYAHKEQLKRLFHRSDQ